MIGWILAAFFAGFVGAGVAGVLVELVGADVGEPIPFSLVFVGQAVGTLIVIAMYSRRVSGSFGADTGLVLAGRDWWAIFAGMGLQIAVALLTVPLLRVMFPEGAPSQGVADIAGESETSLEIIAIFVSVAVIAPILEEILYRGMLLSWLNRFMGKWGAIMVSAAIFAGIHLVDWNARAAVPGLFIVGLVLGWAAMRRGDLSLAVPLHAGVNTLAAFLIVWGDEIIEWLEQQVGELETAAAAVRTLFGFMF